MTSILSSMVFSSAGFESNANSVSRKTSIMYSYKKSIWQCNAAALEKLGVTISKDLDKNKIETWIKTRTILPKLKVSSAEDLAKKIIDYGLSISKARINISLSF